MTVDADRTLATRYPALGALVEREVGQRFTACVVRVEHAGEPPREMAWGAVDGGTAARPAGGATVFDLASLTKLYVTTACLRLVGQGIVALDDPVRQAIPGFRGGDRDRVTFHHLLTHTSGLPAHLHLYRERIGPAEMLEAICAAPLEERPGRHVTYSCLGFILLGSALERLTGSTLDALVADLVTGPLGIGDEVTYCPPEAWSSRIAATEQCGWRGRRLRGEVHDENAAAMGGISGNAGLFGTARGVAALGCLYLQGGRGHNGGEIIPRDVAALAVRDHASTDGERRGLGWMIKNITAPQTSAGRLLAAQSYGHTGFTGTSLWVDPTRHLVVALLTNRVYYGRETTDLLDFRGAVHDAIAGATGQDER